MESNIFLAIFLQDELRVFWIIRSKKSLPKTWKVNNMNAIKSFFFLTFTMSVTRPIISSMPVFADLILALEITTYLLEI